VETIRPTAPMGRPLTERDASAGQALFGPDLPEPADAVALRDARGHRFQRLEFLGDSVLDLLALRHRVLWTLGGQVPQCCAGGWFDPTDRTLAVTNRRRAQLARRLGLPVPSTRRDDDWADQLDFDPGRTCIESGVAVADERVAELVRPLSPA
jgi:hypothetical protein